MAAEQLVVLGAAVMRRAPVVLVDPELAVDLGPALMAGLGDRRRRGHGGDRECCDEDSPCHLDQRRRTSCRPPLAGLAVTGEPGRRT
jgi:hypothetical protein